MGQLSTTHAYFNTLSSSDAGRDGDADDDDYQQQQWPTRTHTHTQAYAHAMSVSSTTPNTIIAVSAAAKTTIIMNVVGKIFKINNEKKIY